MTASIEGCGAVRTMSARAPARRRLSPLATMAVVALFVLPAIVPVGASRLMASPVGWQDAPSAAPSTPSTGAAEEGGGMDERAERARAMREALTSLYVGAASAWFVEMRCRLLDRSGRRAFEWHMGVLTRALQANGAPNREMAALQRLARKDADDARRHDCAADATRTFVARGLKAVRLMVPKLTGLSYDPRDAWMDRHTLIYALVVTALAIGDLCPEFMPADDRARFDGYRTDIERRARANDLSLAELRAQALGRTAAIKSCDGQARTAIAQASKLLSEFEE